MGLLDRIRDEQDQRFMAESTEVLEADRTRKTQLLALEQIVGDAVQKLADSLGEKMRFVQPGLYQVGDLVLCVRSFQYGNELPDPSNRRLATWGYRVSLLGVDLESSKLREHKIGALSLLNYEGIYDAVTKAQEYLQLSAGIVLTQPNFPFRR